MHHAKSWKRSSDSKEKELTKMKAKYRGLEEKLKNKEEELADTHTELLQLRDERDRSIDNYLDSEEFVQVMRAHDDTVFPGFFRTGWDAGISAVQQHYPEIDPGTYQSPDDDALIQQFRMQATISDDPMPDATVAETAAEDSDSSSAKTVRDSGSSSDEE